MTRDVLSLFLRNRYFCVQKVGGFPLDVFYENKGCVIAKPPYSFLRVPVEIVYGKGAEFPDMAVGQIEGIYTLIPGSDYLIFHAERVCYIEVRGQAVV